MQPVKFVQLVGRLHPGATDQTIEVWGSLPNVAYLHF